MRGDTQAELLMTQYLTEFRLPFAREHVFAAPRRWRFDFAIPSLRLAIEIDGGVWTAGRHTRGRGFEADCRKLNAAAALGWRVLRFTPGMVRRGEAAEALSQLLGCLVL